MKSFFQLLFGIPNWTTFTSTTSFFSPIGLTLLVFSIAHSSKSSPVNAAGHEKFCYRDKDAAKKFFSGLHFLCGMMHSEFVPCDLHARRYFSGPGRLSLYRSRPDDLPAANPSETLEGRKADTDSKNEAYRHRKKGVCPAVRLPGQRSPLVWRLVVHLDAFSWLAFAVRSR